MSTDAVLQRQKELFELESRAKALRSEVRHLETTQQSIAVSEATETRLIEMSQNSDVVASESSAAGAGSTRRSAGAGKKKKKSAQPEPGLPQDFIDDLTHKASDVSAVVAEHKRLQTELQDLQHAIEAAEAKQRQIDADTEELRAVIGADEDNKSRAAAGLKKRNEYNYALQQLVRVYEERENIHAALRSQSMQLGRMAALVEETINAREQKEEARAVLAAKQADLRKLQAERAATERAVATKDKNLEKKDKGPTAEEAVRTANMDRRVAMLELQREQEHIRETQTAIRQRNVQIARLEKRLEMIGDAVAGDGLAEEERVDAETVDALIAEVHAAYRRRADADTRADALDAEIERLDYKCGALARTTEGTRREMEKIEKEHQKYLNTLRKEVEQEETINNRNIDILEREISTLRTNRRRQRLQNH